MDAVNKQAGGQNQGDDPKPDADPTPRGSTEEKPQGLGGFEAIVRAAGQAGQGSSDNDRDDAQGEPSTDDADAVQKSLALTSSHLKRLINVIAETERTQAVSMQVSRLGNATFDSLQAADAALRKVRSLTTEVAALAETGALDKFLVGEKASGFQKWRSSVLGLAARDLDRKLAFGTARELNGEKLSFEEVIFKGQLPAGADPNVWGDAVEAVIGDQVRIVFAAEMWTLERGSITGLTRPARDAFITELHERRSVLIERRADFSRIPPNRVAAALRAYRMSISSALLPITAARLHNLREAASIERELLRLCRRCAEAKLANVTFAVLNHVEDVASRHEERNSRGGRLGGETSLVGEIGVLVLYNRTWQWMNGLETERNSIEHSYRLEFQDSMLRIKEAQRNRGLDPDSSTARQARAGEVNRVREGLKDAMQAAINALGDGARDSVIDLFLSELQSTRENFRGGLGAKIAGGYEPETVLSKLDLEEATFQALEAAVGPLR